jgi:cytochrome c oxidase subunit 2
MRTSKLAVSILAALFVATIAVRAQEPTPAPAAEPRKITVTAKKYEFSPSKIELKVGEPVEITFQSQDTKHGFSCKALGIEKVVFEKDKPETVRLNPQKAGTYEFKCAKFCGMGHGKMKGEILVTAADAPHS